MVERNDSSGQHGQAPQKARSEPPFSSLSEIDGPSYQTINRTPTTTPSDQDAKKAVAELDSIRRGELWIIGINSLAVLLALGVCLIYYFQLQVMKGQLQVMRGQLSEMKSGSTDTHELAVQAKNQADAVKTQAESTKAVAQSGVDQAKATNKLATESSRSADAAITNAKAAQEATVNGQKSLTLSERIMFVQERPWVGINGFSATVDNEGKVSGTIGFNNFGHSPAFDSELKTACTLNKPPELSIESTYLFKPSGSKAIVMPGGGKSSDGMTCDLHLSFTQSNLVEQGFAVIYLFGTITYRDSINSSNRIHITRFCGKWNPKTKVFDDCQTYNSAD
ncbi:MAG TPA: hypothetical protein VGK22_21730 [Candidatus Angelobacter sp.]